jgi:transcriptional regulator of acetoin/glycerol metabolism
MGLADDEEDSGEIPAAGSTNSLYAIRDGAEKEAIRDALTKTAGNVSHCSRILEVDRKVLIRTMERLGIRPEEFK